jgi:hypothetical protein
VVAGAFLVPFLVGQGLERAALWAAVLGLPVAIVGSAAAMAALLPRSSKGVPPPEVRAPNWAVGRPAELDAVVKLVTRGRGETVGITTGLYGAGGFGKTTLALMVCADRRVRRRFRGRVYLVTVGRDLRGSGRSEDQ